MSLLPCNPCGAKHPTLFRVVESVACVTVLSISLTPTSFSVTNLRVPFILTISGLLLALVGCCCHIEQLFWVHHLHWIRRDLGFQEVWSKCISKDGLLSLLRQFGTRNRRNHGLQVLHKLRIFRHVHNLH